MKTSHIRIITTMSFVALVAFTFASKTFAAVNSYIIFTAADGKTMKVDVSKDGSFVTSALKAGRVKVQFFWDRSSSKAASLAVTGNPGGSPSVSQDAAKGINSPNLATSSDRESSAPSVSEITITYHVQVPTDARGGMGAGKITFNPFSITRKIDKASTLPPASNGIPTHSLDFGSITIEADCAGIIGKIVMTNINGNKMGMDDWSK